MSELEELRREVAELREYKLRSEREGRKRWRTDSYADRREFGAYRAACEAAGYAWKITGYREVSGFSPIEQGIYERDGVRATDTVDLLRHCRERDRAMLAAYMAGRGSAFPNADEIKRMWHDGYSESEIAPFLPS